MARSLNDMLRDADELIEKKASKKEAPVTSSDDEVTKLASLLVQDEQQEKTAQPLTAIEETPFEKAAHALAIVETLQTIEQFEKIAQFQEHAKANGYTDAQISEYLEKKAALSPIHKFVTIPGALVGLAGGAGYAKGNQKGYSKALDDVNKAFESVGHESMGGKNADGN